MAHVVLSFDRIIDHARLPDVIRRQSGALIGGFESASDLRVREAVAS